MHLRCSLLCFNCAEHTFLKIDSLCSYFCRDIYVDDESFFYQLFYKAQINELYLLSSPKPKPCLALKTFQHSLVETTLTMMRFDRTTDYVWILFISFFGNFYRQMHHRVLDFAKPSVSIQSLLKDRLLFKNIVS